MIVKRGSRLQWQNDGTFAVVDAAGALLVSLRDTHQLRSFIDDLDALIMRTRLHKRAEFVEFDGDLVGDVCTGHVPAYAMTWHDAERMVRVAREVLPKS